MKKKPQPTAKTASTRPRVRKSSPKQSVGMIARLKRQAQFVAEKVSANRYTGLVVKSRRVQLFAKWFLAPALLYLVAFYFFNPHYWGQFSHGFFLDKGDGYQNVWNVWWIDWSITELGRHPWFTTYLHWPSGISLITQTMNPFNGLVMLPFMNLFGMSLVAAVNTMVVFSFVMSGVTMFWLVRYLLGQTGAVSSRRNVYAVALLAGAMFTFSSYHFGHAIGHMQLVSMEWIPLFLLAWWRLLERPSYKLAAGSAFVLFLIVLCDYYYVFYSVIAVAIVGLYFLWKKQVTINKRTLKIFALFALLCLLLVVPFFYKLANLNKVDPLAGSHDAAVFSLDPFMTVIPGGAWQWSELTEAIWTHWPYASESSVYFGLSLIVPLALVLFWRKRFALPKWINVWWIMFFVFAILSLGPRLKVGAATLDSVPLPYAWMTKLIPTLEVSGMPMRMIIMTLVSGVVIAAFAFNKIKLDTRKGKLLFAGIVALFIVEVYPNPSPLSFPTYPEYVTVLKDLNQRSGTAIIDNAAVSGSEALFYQTIHHKPMAFGYTTRTTKSVDEQNFHIFADIEQARHGNLCRVYHIRYFATRVYYDNGFPVIYQDPKSKIHIYDMKNSESC